MMRIEIRERIEIVQPNVLVVEGVEEQLLFEALVAHMGLSNIQIMPIGGKTRIRDYLRTLTKTPGFTKVLSLGIVRDADEDPYGAFQSVCDALRCADLSVPQRPLVPAGHNPKIVIMILPEESTPGMLEDLCLKAVEEDLAMFCVDQYFQCLQEQRVPPPSSLSKARVQVFLASRKEVKRLGEAALAGYWPLDGKAFEQVRNFLQEIV